MKGESGLISYDENIVCRGDTIIVNGIRFFLSGGLTPAGTNGGVIYLCSMILIEKINNKI